MLAVEKPHVDGFVNGLAEVLSAAEGEAEVPFVLLALNGGDEPLTTGAQARIASLYIHGLAASYACNLHAPTNPSRFRPLPIGVPGGSSPAAGEAALARAAAAALPWADRDARLLVTPMRLTSRARRLYLATLSSPAYSELVHVVNERLPPAAFLDLLAAHRAVLSPPGRGLDCFRTWQALALGRTLTLSLSLTLTPTLTPTLTLALTWQALALGSVPLVPRDQANPSTR